MAKRKKGLTKVSENYFVDETEAIVGESDGVAELIFVPSGDIEDVPISPRVQLVDEEKVTKLVNIINSDYARYVALNRGSIDINRLLSRSIAKFLKDNKI